MKKSIQIRCNPVPYFSAHELKYDKEVFLQMHLDFIFDTNEKALSFSESLINFINDYKEVIAK